MTTHSIPVKTHIFSIPAVGKVEAMIAPGQRGRVRFQATSWPARFYDVACQVTVLTGEPVTVVGRQGLTLLILPALRGRRVEDGKRMTALATQYFRYLTSGECQPS